MNKSLDDAELSDKQECQRVQSLLHLMKFLDILGDVNN